MGQSLEKAVSKAATESGLLGIESAEINFDSDINLNLDSSAIGIVVAVLVGLVIVVVIIITLCSRYCCNCCDNLCFQGRGQNLHKKKQIVVRDGQYGSEYHSNLNPAMSILPPDYEAGHAAGCPSCGSQVGGYATSMKRAPSMAASIFARETISRQEEVNKNKIDGFVIPVSNTSDYHTLNNFEKGHLMGNNPTIQYCTMQNGEVGMYIPKANLMDVLDHSQSKSATLKVPSMKYYSSNQRSCTLKPKALDYYTTETENETRKSRTDDKRRRRRRSKTSRSSGYKSDSSQSRPKSNRTITLSSLSDNEEIHHRRKMTIIEETKKRTSPRERAGKGKLSNVEEQLFHSSDDAFATPVKRTYT